MAEGAAAGGPAIVAVASPVLASGSSAVAAERCAVACLRTNLCLLLRDLDTGCIRCNNIANIIEKKPPLLKPVTLG